MGKALYKILIKIYREILEVIYPPREQCVICEEAPFIGICPCCKSEIKRAAVINEKNISYGFYGNGLKKLILDFKYKANFISGDVLSLFLYELITEKEISFDVICYIPMTKEAVKVRGFNQCKVMASNISYYTNIPMSNCIKKVKSTREQKTLNHDERIRNIKDAFVIYNNKSVFNKRVILIDDVTTTGSTISECEKILKKAGAKEIIILTLAKSNI